MFSINLQWKDFPLNLQAIETWARANAGESYCGNSADSQLTLWFSETPSQDVQDAVQAYWNAISTASQEATSYKTNEQLASEAATAKAAAKASAAAKFEALGLSSEEIAAILG